LNFQGASELKVEPMVEGLSDYQKLEFPGFKSNQDFQTH
jgi:hypothetical protein